MYDQNDPYFKRTQIIFKIGVVGVGGLALGAVPKVMAALGIVCPALGIASLVQTFLVLYVEVSPLNIRMTGTVVHRWCGTIWWRDSLSSYPHFPLPVTTLLSPHAQA